MSPEFESLQQPSEKAHRPPPPIFGPRVSNELLCQPHIGLGKVLLTLNDFPHRRALQHADLPCRVGAELFHGKSAAHAPAVKNQRVAIGERVLIVMAGQKETAASDLPDAAESKLLTA